MAKKFLIFLLLILNISTIYSVDCYFETNSCQRTMNSFNTFNLAFNNNTAHNDLFDSFNAKIYDKENPSNEILVDVNQI